ncbi:MAG: divergent PAP2 family protein [Clostridia bacterium]|nr:divergent PAP2 family protein [Clostridia bacterium]
MEILLGFITNKVLVSAAAAWFVAQAFKMVLDAAKGEFTAERLAGGGGMPSAHSATVTGLAASTAIVYGGDGFEFPMALFLAIIVIYDAMGVRFETGQQAKALNKLRCRDLAENREPIMEDDLKEKMGHTLPEIIAGCAVGIIIAILICNLIPEV